MKTIEVDDELYSYIASHTKHIGESASDILRRMLKFSATTQPTASAAKGTPAAQPVAEAKPANPVKDKVRAMRELLLSDEYAEQEKSGQPLYADSDYTLFTGSPRVCGGDGVVAWPHARLFCGG